MTLFTKFVPIALCALAITTTPVSADLKAAQTALVQKDFPRALSEARIIRQTHPIDAILIEARALLELGQPEKSEALMQKLVQAAPKFYAARMLLGASLMAQNKRTAGEIQYRRALDLATTKEQRTLTSSILQNIQSRRAFSIDGAFGFIPSTNIGKATTNKTVELTYGDATITSDKQKSGIGVHGSLSVARNFYLANGFRLSLGVSGYERRYKDTSYNQASRSFKISLKDIRPVRATSDLFLSYRTSTFAGDPYSTTMSTGITTAYCLTKNCKAFRTGLTIDKTTLAESSHPDSYGVKASGSIDLYKKPNMVITATGELQKRHSQNISYDYKAVSVGLRGVYLPAGSDIVVSGGINRSLKKWTDIAALFVDRRFDLSWEYNLSLKNPKLSYFGFTPSLDYTFTDRRSSINIYEIKSHDVFLGVSNAF